MAKKEATPETGGAGNVEAALSRSAPRSLALASTGIKTGSQFAAVMSALISDIIEEKVTPSIANAACNAGSKLLKVVEMQMKYGKRDGDEGKPILMLA